jgi:murein DD-endopeptidase MepM/ murein hydrolase activator NlpD
LISKRKRYKYNSSTLTFVEIRPSPGKKFLHALVSFVYINILAIFLLSVIYSSIDSPEVTIQKARIGKLSEKYQSLATRVDSLSTVLQMQHFTHDQRYRNILELDSISQNIRMAGTGGSDPYASAPKSYSSKFFSELMLKIENLKAQIEIQEASYDELMVAALEKNKKLEHYPSIPPVKTDTYIWISSYFGVREDPFTFSRKSHTGLDFVGPKNTNIFATAKGIVTFVKQSRRGYGNEIVIDHGFGYSTRYAHLNKILVTEGQEIDRGTLIGLMGNTGRSTGRHLHYEVRFQDRPVNPLYYFSDDLEPGEFEQLTKKTE